jgi:hypothetical protein
MENGKNIFDLEQAIMSMWGTKEDLELLYRNVMDRSPEMTTDEIANVLLGLISLHDMRSQQCFEIFENVCRQYHQYRKQAEGVRSEFNEHILP